MEVVEDLVLPDKRGVASVAGLMAVVCAVTSGRAARNPRVVPLEPIEVKVPDDASQLILQEIDVLAAAQTHLIHRAFPIGG